MNKNLQIKLIVSMLFLGILFFLYKKELIIFRFLINYGDSDCKNIQNSKIKKSIKLFYWLNEKWNYENVEIISSNNLNENIKQIVSSWLNLLEEEKILNHKISLQSILSGVDDKEILLSFDRILLNDDHSTYDKLLLIESLIKTLRENELKISKIKFLNHHQEIDDTHLNFKNSWPIQGFINN